MSDVEKYIVRRKRTHPGFTEGFEEGYREFEAGVLRRQDREEAGLNAGGTCQFNGHRKTDSEISDFRITGDFGNQ